jgi:hypothetical protein
MALLALPHSVFQIWAIITLTSDVAEVMGTSVFGPAFARIGDQSSRVRMSMSWRKNFRGIS